MADSRRKQITDAILTRIQGVTGIGEVGKEPKQEDEASSYPAAFVWATIEKKERRTDLSGFLSS